VVGGPGVVRYFTGNAITQTRGENLKYLDLEKAKPAQLKMIGKLYLERGMILITDSGTIGRVIYASAYHDGAVGTNNLIRVVIEDKILRGYVYQFLQSKLGQNQLKANVYGAIVDHIEPDDVKKILVPIPKNPAALEAIGLPTLRCMELQEQAYIEQEISRIELAQLGGFPSEVDPDFPRKIHSLIGPKTESIAPVGLEHEFKALAENWRRSTQHTSSLTKMIAHPAYRRIMGMGRDALPFIFRELKERPDHWFVALNAITGEDPAPIDGKFNDLVDAWLAWGKDKGYIQ
jgi:hypothetical protein